MIKYLLSVCTISTCWFLSPTNAHDYWADGKAVPNWVKASCCGPADAHHLRPDQVHKFSRDEAKKLRPKYAKLLGSYLDYYVVDGYFAQYMPMYEMLSRHKMENIGCFTIAVANNASIRWVAPDQFAMNNQARSILFLCPDGILSPRDPSLSQRRNFLADAETRPRTFEPLAGGVRLQH
jgi:hypothetical protein